MQDNTATKEVLRIINMNEVEAENVCWLWEPYIPAGKITLVQGDPGDGKTTMVLAIAAALTKGSPLPDRIESDVPVSVIYQTAEDGLADTIKPRLLSLAADCTRVHVVDETEKGLSLSDERIERAILRTGAKLFILDPLQAYLGAEVDMHRANCVRPVLKQLGLVAEKTGCAIVIIGHLNKGNGSSQYRGLGSIDIHAAARSVLTVGKIGGGENRRAMVHGKSNLAPSGASHAFELDPARGFCWLGECSVTLDELLRGMPIKTENQFGRARILLENELTACPRPAVEVMQKAEEEGISPKTLNRAKAALGVKSYREGGRWFWSLPVAVMDVEPSESQDGQTSLCTALTILPKSYKG